MWVKTRQKSNDMEGKSHQIYQAYEWWKCRFLALPAINIFISCCLLLRRASVGFRSVRCAGNKTVHLLLSPLSETIFTPAAAARVYFHILHCAPAERCSLWCRLRVLYYFLSGVYERTRALCRCMTLFASTSVNGDVHPSSIEIASKTLPHTHSLAFCTLLMHTRRLNTFPNISPHLNMLFAFHVAANASGEKQSSRAKICSSDAKKIRAMLCRV